MSPPFPLPLRPCLQLLVGTQAALLEHFLSVLEETAVGPCVRHLSDLEQPELGLVHVERFRYRLQCRFEIQAPGLGDLTHRFHAIHDRHPPFLRCESDAQMEVDGNPDLAMDYLVRLLPADCVGRGCQWSLLIHSLRTSLSATESKPTMLLLKSGPVADMRRM